MDESRQVLYKFTPNGRTVVWLGNLIKALNAKWEDRGVYNFLSGADGFVEVYFAPSSPEKALTPHQTEIRSQWIVGYREGAEDNDAYSGFKEQLVHYENQLRLQAEIISDARKQRDEAWAQLSKAETVLDAVRTLTINCFIANSSATSEQLRDALNTRSRPKEGDAR